MKISKALLPAGLSRREFFKAGLAGLGTCIAMNTAKAEGDGKIPLPPPSRADRLRKERDDREEAMRQWGSFSEGDIQRMRDVYAEEIARGTPITKEAVLGTIGVLGVLIATGVIAVLGDEDESPSNQNQDSKK